MLTTLYTKDSKGKTRFWEVSSTLKPINDQDHVEIVIRHGVLDSDKIQIKTRIAKPKNIGKANETTGATQAEKDIQSLITAQKDKGYVEDINDYVEPFRPMLAHKWADRAHKIDWNNGVYHVSPKLDGIRCFILVTEQGTVSYISRTGKPFKDFLHITAELKHTDWYKAHQASNNNSDTSVRYVLDGELYNHDLEFNQISSLVNSEQYDAETDTSIQFHMYDFIDMRHVDQAFPDRLSSFTGTSAVSYIRLVPQTKIESEEDLKRLFSSYIADGYEGAMIKSQDPYVFGARSNSLLKYKEMQTDEFKIKDIFLSPQDPTKVQVEFYTDFFKRPESSFEVGSVKGNKEELYNTLYVNKSDYIGKWMTVQYQTWSTTEDPKPLFGVGLVIRDGEETEDSFIPSH